MYNFSKVIFGLCFLLTLIGCMNEYEKELLGKYRVSEGIQVEDPILLDLKEDKSFSLSVGDSLYSGKWMADDNGDFTWIEFTTRDSVWSWGYVGSRQIKLNDPRGLHLPVEVDKFVVINSR